MTRPDLKLVKLTRRRVSTRAGAFLREIADHHESLAAGGERVKGTVVIGLTAKGTCVVSKDFYPRDSMQLLGAMRVAMARIERSLLGE